MQTVLRFLVACWIVISYMVIQAAEPENPLGHTDSKLWNGWGMTPTGQIVPLSNLANLVPGVPASASAMHSDLPLRLVISPDGKFVLAACGGYNNTGLAALNLAEKRVARFFPLPQVFNGLAFSNDGQRVFVSGGDSGVLHFFKYEKGELNTAKPAQ